MLQASRGSFPFVERVFADAAYNADRVAQATRIAIEIVHKPKDPLGTAVLSMFTSSVKAVQGGQCPP